MASYARRVFASMQLAAGGSVHTRGALWQPLAVQLPSMQGSADKQDLPGLGSMQASASKFPQRV
jgi:hypothetical protein